MNSCGREDLVVGDEAPVGGVAQVIGHGVKVIGAEVGVHGEEGREKDEEVRVEVKGKVEALRERDAHHVFFFFLEMKVKDSRDDLSQCGCDACEKNKTSNSVQVCSVLHVALVLVCVRLVTVVIVHIGHQDEVVVVIHFRSHFVRDLLY